MTRRKPKGIYWRLRVDEALERETREAIGLTGEETERARSRYIRQAVREKNLRLRHQRRGRARLDRLGLHRSAGAHA